MYLLPGSRLMFESCVLRHITKKAKPDMVNRNIISQARRQLLLFFFFLFFLNKVNLKSIHSDFSMGVRSFVGHGI